MYTDSRIRSKIIYVSVLNVITYVLHHGTNSKLFKDSFIENIIM